jgi:hypothetical protein
MKTMISRSIAFSGILALLIVAVSCRDGQERRQIAETGDVNLAVAADGIPQPSGTIASDLPEAARAIDSYCQAVSDIAEKRDSPDRIFADISDQKYAEWKEFRSEAELKAFRENSETYSIAYNWFNSDRLVLTRFTFFSESGDWAKYVTSCYRMDGSLALASVDFRTFYGHFAMDRNIYYSEDGRVIARTESFYGLREKKPVTPSQEDLETNADRMKEDDHYITVSALPYAKPLTNR